MTPYYQDNQQMYVPIRSRGTGVFFAFDYLIGLAVFGFIYWLLNGILPAFEVMSATGIVHDLANFLWWIVLVIYLVLGPFYFWNRLKEWG
jgi:hypothetical protein